MLFHVTSHHKTPFQTKMHTRIESRDFLSVMTHSSRFSSISYAFFFLDFFHFHSQTGGAIAKVTKIQVFNFKYSCCCCWAIFVVNIMLYEMLLFICFKNVTHRNVFSEMCVLTQLLFHHFIT